MNGFYLLIHLVVHRALCTLSKHSTSELHHNSQITAFWVFSTQRKFKCVKAQIYWWAHFWSFHNVSRPYIIPHEYMQLIFYLSIRKLTSCPANGNSSWFWALDLKEMPTWRALLWHLVCLLIRTLALSEWTWLLFYGRKCAMTCCDMHLLKGMGEGEGKDLRL